MTPILTVIGYSTFIGTVVQTDYPCNVPAAISDALPYTYAVALSDGEDPSALAAVLIVKSDRPHEELVPGIAAYVRLEPQLSILIRSKFIATAARLDVPDNTSPTHQQMRDVASEVYRTFPR